MALLVAGEHAAAERAFAWALAGQRADGSWPMKYVAGAVEDASGETNMSAYLAVARLAPLAGPPRRGVRGPVLADGAPGARLGRARCSCRSAASPGRRSGPTAGPATVHRDALLAALVEHPPGAAGRASRWPS